MRSPFKVSILLLLLLSACNLPTPETTAAQPPTDTPEQAFNSTECGFVWAHEPLDDLSKEFDAALKAEEQNASGRVEAYGENCITSQGEVARFLAMETDFYITLEVPNLEDKQTLGKLIEEVLVVLAEFPVEQTPGPQPGYVGITFKSPSDELRLWFPQREAEAALEKGLRGIELFEALQAK